MKSWECSKDACDMLVPLGTYYHLPLGIEEQDTQMHQPDVQTPLGITYGLCEELKVNIPKCNLVRDKQFAAKNTLRSES